MIRIAIVDDESGSQRLLQDYLDRYRGDYGETFEVALFYDGKDIVRHYQPYFDIIFLDVKMADVDGFSAAKRIREIDTEVILIFITNMAQYAIKGYEVDALSYLLKPVPYFAFSQELKRSLKRLEKHKQQYLFLPHEHGLLRLDAAGIYYIEREKHRVSIHTGEDTYSIVGTIKEIESKLDRRYFFRCNSGYIVNMERVTEVRDNFVFLGAYKLQISRPKKKAFMTALTDYLGGSRK
jgi:DNA-binding LytR/AlgR family response regulator